MHNLDKIFNALWYIEEYTGMRFGSNSFRNLCIKYLSYDPE